MQLDASEKQRSVREIVMALKSAIKRYWRIGVGPALVLLGLLGFLSTRIPNYFNSSALLVIKPQRLTSKIVENPSKEEMQERLNTLAQEILSRPRLRSVMDDLNLYPELQGLNRERALLKFSDNITKEYVTSATGSHSNQIFKLGFTHQDKNKAYEVAKELSRLFIEGSMIDQRSEVQGTADFLDAELGNARRKLEVTENQVQEFVRQNFGKLPEHLDAAIARLENAQNQIAVNSQMITANLTRRENLQREVSELSRQSAVGNADGSRGSSELDPEMGLSQLESALVVLQSKYSDQHPDVINTKRRIEALRAGLGNSDGERSKARGLVLSGSVDHGAIRTTRRQLDEVSLQVETLQRENERLKQSVANLQKDIESMPIKEQELIKIKRDYENVKDNYQKLLSAREDAKIQSNLIQSQKAPQFAIIEPAERPVFPAGPNRMLILAGGVAISLLVFIAIPILMFFVNGAFKFTDDVEDALGIPVIGVVPSMVTVDSLQFQRRLNISSLVASFVSFFVGLGVISWVL